MVCIREVSLRKNPSLSASNIPIKVTSGKSNPSRKRFTPHSTSNSPFRSAVNISIRSMVLMSLCKYLAFSPCSLRYSDRLSAIFLVSVVANTLPPLLISLTDSFIKSSTWPPYDAASLTGLTVSIGSTNPVGLMICSTILSLFSLSNLPGVALTYTVGPTFCSNSS